MLIIRRRRGEALVIEDNIEIEILEISSTQVKLGIRAPRQVRVRRKELQMAMEANRQASAPVSQQALGRLLADLNRPTQAGVTG